MGIAPLPCCSCWWWRWGWLGLWGDERGPQSSRKFWKGWTTWVMFSVLFHLLLLCVLEWFEDIPPSSLDTWGNDSVYFIRCWMLTGFWSGVLLQLLQEVERLSLFILFIFLAMEDALYDPQYGSRWNNWYSLLHPVGCGQDQPCRRSLSFFFCVVLITLTD